LREILTVLAANGRTPVFVPVPWRFAWAGLRLSERLGIQLGFRSDSAVSLVESAKLCGVEPKRYLLTATRAALADHAAVTLTHDVLARS
jgi:hypothetical protein